MRYLNCLLFTSIGLLGYAQHQGKVDFRKADISVELIPMERAVQGVVRYEFDVMEAVDSVFLDARNMEFSLVQLDGREANYTQTDGKIICSEPFEGGTTHTLTIAYKAVPRQTLYFLGWDDEVVGNEQVWTQGQGKYTSHWLPSFDDMEEKVEFDMEVKSTPTYPVIANGQLTRAEPLADGRLGYRFDMEKPMSSYLLAFALGTYERQELRSQSGIPIYNYYYPGDSLRVEPTYRYTKRIFDFLEEEIGVAYPWQDYKQVPVRDFLYAGMENTGCTIFSDGYVIDSTAFIDHNYVNVNAHELAHQWFGNLVTEQSGAHHWLHEGFATYYALLAEMELFGPEHGYWKMYESYLQLSKRSTDGKGESLLSPGAGSLTFYQKGAWALFALREAVGDSDFEEGIRNYLRKYAFSNATIQDFLSEIETASGKDLTDFREVWLERATFPTDQATILLAKKSASLARLFDLRNEIEGKSIDSVDVAAYWGERTTKELKSHLIQQYLPYLPKDTVLGILDSDSLELRRALITTVEDVSRFPRERVESLLEDASYITVEHGLYILWSAYPEARNRYLDATRDIMGLPNKNVRLLWLTLAIMTEGYENGGNQAFFQELAGYTDPVYPFEVRLGAFQYLEQAFGLTDKNLLDLVQATGHHAWQFSKYARELLDRLLKDEAYVDRMRPLVSRLSGRDKAYVENKLNEL